MISGIILGAGASRRMGVPKQTIELAGKTMLERVLDVFEASSLDEVVLVVSPALERKVRMRPRTRVAINTRAGEGISTSVRVGIDALDPRSNAVLIGLADKPLLRKSTIESLLSARRRTRADIVIPVFQRKRGNPILFRRRLFRDLRRLKGDAGAKVLIESRRYSVAEVTVNDSGILLDIDTPGDLRMARKILRARSALRKRKARK